jgi:hypothetical protein
VITCLSGIGASASAHFNDFYEPIISALIPYMEQTDHVFLRGLYVVANMSMSNVSMSNMSMSNMSK